MRPLDDPPPPPPPARIGALTLRRFRAGELDEAERAAIEAAVATSPELRQRLEALDDEQARFEATIPFDRFAGGVERAQRVPSPDQRSRRGLWLAIAGTLAAAAGLAMVVDFGSAERDITRIKGDDDPVDVRIAQPDGRDQRAARLGRLEPLAPGERVRIGVRTGELTLKLVVLSLDEQGMLTALYPQRGGAVEIGPTRAYAYLASAMEFEGKGREHLLIYLADRPIAVEAVMASVRDAFVRAGANLDAFRPPQPEGTAVFEYMFGKP